ncbi:MAG: Uncharacterized protein MK1497 [uncultured Thermomicrobiales bacterium]|uniref:Uncharacterized protein MK1497 n=1 Tax=uncultured Thermomicrobiales bacterium TaxID=1645740 RepID=A0A6J4V4R2_9BACT|nr:MAG: Uncharacterized protein MK1497 [uncultured Thermomicrobiales bacterium]
MRGGEPVSGNSTPGTPDGRILAIDVGAGTQDILIYEPGQTPENLVKLVLPSRTRIVGWQVAAVTRAGRALHLDGTLMGGGASTDAIRAHLAAGLPVSATPAAAGTIHNDPNRVTGMGVVIRPGDAPAGAETVILGDIDLPALASALEPFGVALPATVAVAVQDHGYRPGSGNNDVRFAYLQGIIDAGGALDGLLSPIPAPEMTRMAAVTRAVPGAFVMDTGAAAVLGILEDPRVREAADSDGAVLINAGNMHTFAVLVHGRRVVGLFEHHTSGISAGIVTELVARLRAGTLTNAAFRSEFDGHGAALDPAYRSLGRFATVAVTGPHRGILRDLGYLEAAPHGDMMLAGPFGLVAALRRRIGRDVMGTA